MEKKFIRIHIYDSSTNNARDYIINVSNLNMIHSSSVEKTIIIFMDNNDPHTLRFDRLEQFNQTLNFLNEELNLI